ncbi:MAG: DNA methylase [Sporanaerobacter sp.]|uniref:DNA methyltransferase n=1 Tax=Sporanaerobacter sp. TaxID=2010183 RepID=UPI003A1006C7
MLKEIVDIISQGKREVEDLLKEDVKKVETVEIVGEYNEEKLTNRFISGDNIYIMNALLKGNGCQSMRGKLDLIYIDPPFLSKANYNSKIILPLDDELVTIENFAYSDTWNEGSISYLKMLYKRLLLMRELLSDRGSIYLHLDWHVVHYAKVLMDEIFGEDMFLNEIIWSYKSGGVSKKYFSRKHDTILLYSKTKDYIFNAQKEKSYNRGFKPYRFKGVSEYEDEMGWYTLVNMKDVWNIDMVGRTSSERMGYGTQKPEKLLERIVLASSNEDSVVADFFAGSGTTAVVAERYNRKWILSDLGYASLQATKKRLMDIKSKGFIHEKIEGFYIPKGGRLKIHSIDKKSFEFDTKIISINLEGYEIDIDNIPIEEKYKDILYKVMLKDSLALIDIISIDTDYDGKIFRSRWQSKRDKESYKIPDKIELKLLKKAKRSIGIKIVDVFGFESEYIIEV